MGLVAVTAGLFALGAYLGRDLSYGWGFAAYIASFGLLIGLYFAASRSEQLAIGLLFGFGVLIGLGTAPTIAHFASTNRQSVWQAGGATALFIAGFGAAGYATRRDLSGVARVCFWALLALIVFVIHNYRWRLGLAEGEAQYDDLERQLAEGPAITVPTITLEGDANGAFHPEPSVYANKFSGEYSHRTIEAASDTTSPRKPPKPLPRPS